LSAPTDNQIYAVPANHFSPSAGTTLLSDEYEFKSNPHLIRSVSLKNNLLAIERNDLKLKTLIDIGGFYVKTKMSALTTKNLI